MGDRYATFAHSWPGRSLVRRLGLPEPPALHRYRPGEPLVAGPVLLGGADGGRAAESVAKVLSAAAIEVCGPGEEPDGRHPLYAALIFDATGIVDPTDLRALYDFFHPHARSLYPCGRVIILGTPPAAAGGVAGATAQQALVGFMRSLGKEFGRGITAQLVWVTPGAEANLESSLRFLLSARSAYVSGQVLSVGLGPVTAPADWSRPLAGKTALVTGAARGIGAETARVLARDGADVVCLDLAGAGDTLAEVANEIGGTALQLDLAGPEAPERLVDYLAGRHGRLDILVHNAGITRDRTLAKLDAAGWDAVLDVNLVAAARVNQALLAEGLIGEGGRIVALSSVSGIAGNRGQTNYATAKAGLVGMVQALAEELRPKAVTVNAVAPGFIETPMTARMPAVTRELARRINSMAQGGLPVDVAEAVAFLASPGSGAITGTVLRVCGQSWLGA